MQIFGCKEARLSEIQKSLQRTASFDCTMTLIFLIWIEIVTQKIAVLNVRSLFKINPCGVIKTEMEFEFLFKNLKLFEEFS